MPAGRRRDLTRKATYEVVAGRNRRGRCHRPDHADRRGRSDGPRVGRSGHRRQLKVKVTNLVEDLPINFPNQITPLFTKYSCNGGGCHGKSSGQNGFRLSLLGFEPKEDYEYLVKEGRGRRLFPAAPDQSLLLLKADGHVCRTAAASGSRSIRPRIA